MSTETERTDLIAELAAARAALVTTTNDLTDEQAGARPTVSALCLGGLVKHVAAMEENWLRFAVDGPSTMRFALPDGVTWADMAAGTAREYPQWAIDHQNEFAMQPGVTLASVLARYEDVAKRSEDVIRTLADLSVTHPLPDAPWNRPGTMWSARRAVLHVIAETAQHAGHADLLRETLDGQKST
ncbi:DinB family protein [Amycolatopsis sp. NBC_01488]|uniref:DinB family protein n=1 Tax=Amycolatopsis sp. NBC_01488 TaxID=2903563 RepID=UPI002E2C50D2|nr:DinB family protein [Amycolatopsis sp. NBC_01488]